MKSGSTYRHPSLREVDLHIVEITGLHPDGISLFVAWVNRHYPHILYPDHIEIKTKDLPKWKKLD